jgi:hypothetical protein
VVRVAGIPADFSLNCALITSNHPDPTWN